MQVPPIAGFLLRWLLRLLLVTVLVGIPSLLFYLKVVGIGFGLPERVGEALSGPGFQTRIGKLSFDLLDGLVATRVEVMARNPEPTVIARLNRIAISPNLSEILDGQLAIDNVSLSGASAEVPVSAIRPQSARADNSGFLRVEDLNASLAFLGGRLQLTDFRAQVAGIRISAQGVIDGVSDFALPAPPADGKTGSDWISPALDFLNLLEYPENPPSLSLTFSGDLSQPDRLKIAPATLLCGPIKGEGWKVNSVDLSLTYENGVLKSDRFLITAGGGELQAWLEWANRSLTFSLDSSIPPDSFAGFLPNQPLLKEIHFSAPPILHADGEVKFEDGRPVVRSTGQLTLGPVRYRGVVFDSITAPFSISGQKVFVKGAKVSGPPGWAHLDALYEPGDFRLRLNTEVDPTGLIPVLDAKTSEILERMEFRDRARIRMDFRGENLKPSAWKGTGHLQLGNTAMRGTWIDSLSADLDIENGAFTYREFLVRAGKSKATGEFTYDIPGQLVKVTGVKSDMDPVRVMMWIDPRISETLRDYRFRANPDTRVDGVIYMKEPLRNRLDIDFACAQGIEYDLLGKTLPFSRVRGDVKVRGRQLNLVMPDARLMGGSVSLVADVSMDDRNPTFQISTELKQVDFASLTRLYFGYEGSEGKCSGRYTFSARIGRENLMEGKGQIRVEDGNVFAIPFLGPFSEILNKIIAGVGYDPARLATADFTVANEKIHTDNMVIQGNGFSLFGDGDIYFMQDRLDLTIRINAQGIPGIVLFPVSKLFEYHSNGTLSDPQWRPKVIPNIPLPGAPSPGRPTRR